jgi:hypothetical protein
MVLYIDFVRAWIIDAYEISWGILRNNITHLRPLSLKSKFAKL